MINRYRLQACDASSQQEDASYPLSVNHTIVITDDKSGVAPLLAEKFKANRYRCEVVTEVPAHGDVVILLDGLRRYESEKESIETNLQTFRHIKQIAKRFSEKGGLLITVQDTGGEFGLTPFDKTRAFSAGFSGIVKTASLEWPKAVCKSIDLQQASQKPVDIAKRLFSEITQGASALECGLVADGRRVISDVVLAEAKPGKLVISKQDTIVVLGGGRGITASCLIELARRTQTKFALLGRTALEEVPVHYLNKTDIELKGQMFEEAKQQNTVLTPKQISNKVAQISAALELQKNLQALRDAGSEVEYFSTDILNVKNLQDTMAQVREKFGKITAIVHGAGVLADKLLTDLTEDNFLRVFNTKVLGLHHLLQATADDPIRFIGLFSSVAARFGNVGQAAYAMGNEVLNKVAQAERHQRGSACLVKSYNWGPWDSGMVTPELKEMFLKRGINPLPEKDGVKMFVDEMTVSNADDVEVVCGAKLNV